jgi:hypothetical protein
VTSPYASDHQDILGWHPAMPNEAYHSSPGLSKSSLDLVHKSIAHLKHRQAVRKETPAMLLGTAVHSAILEPWTWPDDYAKGPEADRRTTAWANAVAEASATGKILLPPDCYDKVEAMRESVLSLDSPYITSIQAREGHAEGSLFEEEPVTGALIKIRPDFIIPELKTVLDVKTTKDARPSEFARSCGNFRYDVQAALYTDVAAGHWGGDSNEWTFVFLTVENQSPFNAAIYTLDPGDIDDARVEYLADINKYMQWAEGYEPNEGYAEEETCLTIPKYIKRSR